MKILRVFVCISVLWGGVGLLRGQAAADDNSPPNIPDLLPQHHAVVAGPALTLDEIERMAMIGNPEIRVAARRLAVVEAHAPVAGALDDLTLMYRGWQVPLREPWNYNAAQNMFMLSQTFPGSASVHCARAWQKRMWPKRRPH